MLVSNQETENLLGILSRANFIQELIMKVKGWNTDTKGIKDPQGLIITEDNTASQTGVEN